MTAEIIQLNRPRAAIGRLEATVVQGRPFRQTMTIEERRFMEDLEALLGWADHLEKRLHPIEDDEQEASADESQ